MAKHSDNSNEVDSTTDRVQRRRLMKHMVEKRRRNRINDCLENMRKLVLKAQNKNPDNYTKMEKADILEMTTNFLAILNQQKEATSKSLPQSTFPVNQVRYDVTPSTQYGDHLIPENQTRSLVQNIAQTQSLVQDYSKGYATCQAEIRNYLNNYRMTNVQSHAMTSPLCSPTSTQGYSEQSKNINSPLYFQYPSSTVSNASKVAPRINHSMLDNFPHYHQSAVQRSLHLDLNKAVDNATVSSSEVWRPW